MCVCDVIIFFLPPPRFSLLKTYERLRKCQVTRGPNDISSGGGSRGATVTAAHGAVAASLRATAALGTPNPTGAASWPVLSTPPRWHPAAVPLSGCHCHLTACPLSPCRSPMVRRSPPPCPPRWQILLGGFGAHGAEPPGNGALSASTSVPLSPRGDPCPHAPYS